MKKLIPAMLVALAALGGCTVREPQISPAEQASLDSVLAGRTPRAPVSCVNLRDVHANRGFGEGVILFEGPTKRTVYVNRPPGGCPELNPFRALRVKTTTTQICRGDIVSVFDATSGIDYGSCGLGDFVEYRK
ncbi:MAG: hypothetical protein JWN69_1867 [Alphaproteobacteria bacterium]|nr:hypothetical protein [Alphaproteobacteria bacterium]